MLASFIFCLYTPTLMLLFFNCLSSLKYDVIFAQRKMFFTIYIFTYLCLFIVCAYVGSCVGRYNDMEICLSVPTKEVYWDSL